ncbi:beta-lactamase regulator AmpE [Planctobacterium marinum]
MAEKPIQASPLIGAAIARHFNYIKRTYMTLISLLLVIALERLTTKSNIWRSETYMLPYLDFLRSKGWLYTTNAWQIYLAVAMPTLVMWWIFLNLESSLLTLVLNLVVLFIAVGCPHIRAKFKGYLQASNRGDFAARDLYAEELKFIPANGISFGQHMVWINFRYYFAIAFWFLILGGTGAVMYLTARLLESQAPDESQRKVAARVMTILDWVPARIAACGFLLVGHFTQGVKSFSSYLFDLTISARDIVTQVAKSSEEVEPDTMDCTEEPCTLLRLAKRNMMLLLAVTAVLTLGGWIN